MKLFLSILLVILLSGCQTIENKSQEIGKKEVKEISKFIQQPESELKIVMGEPDEIIHKGISHRSFSRSFTIADDVKVDGAELKDRLLTINCEKIIPEQKKKKLIPIK